VIRLPLNRSDRAGSRVFQALFRLLLYRMSLYWSSKRPGYSVYPHTYYLGARLIPGVTRVGGFCSGGSSNSGNHRLRAQQRRCEQHGKSFLRIKKTIFFQELVFISEFELCFMAFS
jgi:hypothetical protein